MRVLVCGGRDYDDRNTLFSVMDELHSQQPVTTLVCGMARGADRLAWEWARSRNIPRDEHPADWTHHGRSAGFRRNETMLTQGQPAIVVSFPGGNGTEHMVKIATDAGIPVVETCTFL